MPELQRPAATLHYDTLGDGPPLVLLAGIASDGASWAPLVPLLPDRRLILIDNRGSGRSRAEGELALEDIADDAAALLDHLAIASADVVGHSLGGLLGLLLGARHPARVRRLVTLASGTISAPARVLFRDLARLYFTTAPEDWFRLLYQWLFSDPFFADERNVAAAAAASTAYAYHQSPGDFARQIAAVDRFAGFDASSVRCPVLAVAAERDLLAPPPAVAALHADVPNLRRVTVPAAAHSVHWERPTEVAEAIRAFLA